MKITTTSTRAQITALRNGDAIELDVWTPRQELYTVTSVAEQDIAPFSDSQPVAVRQLKGERLDATITRVTLVADRSGL